MSTWQQRAALMAAILGLAGCRESAGVDERAASAKQAPRVVVAVIDTAFNPYHSFFHETQDRLRASPIYPPGRGPSAVTPELLAELGVPPERQIALTHTGRFAEDYAADEAKWAAMRPRRLYWFKGTNVLAISFAGGDFARQPLRPMVEKNPHGVGTTASVLAANPEAVVILVETAGNLGNPAAHEFAFLHPSVDVVSTSYGAGLPLVPIGTGAFLPELTAFEHSFDGVVQMGKLHFSSGGNQPGLTSHRAGAGPWWSIGVSGSQEDESAGTHGREPASGYFPDFIADFRQDIPYCLDCAFGLRTGVSGTSFSTPRAAGVASRVILEARRRLQHGGGIRFVDGTPVMVTGAGQRISNWHLRRALEEAAYVPAAGEAAGAGAPVPDVAPWLVTGWGDLTADPRKGVVAEALAQLGLSEPPKRIKDAGFCDFQTKIIEERKLWFDRLALDAGSRTLPATDPFVYCDSRLPDLH